MGSLVSCKKSENKKSLDREFFPALDTEKEISLNILGTYGNFEALEQVINDFNVFYPNVTISYEFTNNILVSSTNRCVAKDNVDIIFAYSKEYNYYYKDFAKQYLVDLEQAGIHYSNIEDRIYNAVKFDGRYTIFPVYNQTVGIIVNTSLLSKYNIPIPGNLSEFEAACDKFLANGITPIYSSSEYAGELFFNKVVFDVLHSENKDEIIDELNSGKARSELFDESYRILKDWNSKGYFDFSADELESSYGPYILRFFKGDIPFMIGSSDTISGMRKREQKSEAFTEKPFKYTYIPAPTGKDGYECVAFPSLFFGVCNVSEHLDYAIEFMKFLSTKEELKTMTVVKGMPGVIRTTEDYRLEKFENLKENEILYSGEDGISGSALNVFFYILAKLTVDDEDATELVQRYQELMSQRLENIK